MRRIRPPLGKDLTEFVAAGGRLLDWTAFHLARVEVAHMTAAPPSIIGQAVPPPDLPPLDALGAHFQDVSLDPQQTPLAAWPPDPTEPPACPPAPELCGCGQPLPSGHHYRCRACIDAAGGAS